MLSGKAACPPLLPFGLSCEQHFEHSLARVDEPLPTEQPTLMDLDLQFAADSMAGNYGSLRDARQGAVRALRELKSRWARVSTRLRHLQPDAIRAATQQRDLGLLGLLVVLLSWNDVAMPLGFVQGRPIPAEPTTAQPLCEARKRWLVHQVLHHRKAEVLEIARRVKPAKRSHYRLLRPILDDCAHRRGESGHRGQHPVYLPGCTSLPLLLGPSWRASGFKDQACQSIPLHRPCASRSRKPKHIRSTPPGAA